MRRSISIRRKPWQLLVGLFITTLCVMGFWSSQTVAQSTDSVCPSGLVAPAITNKANLPVYEVTKDLGVARVGPNDDCKRLTPLPRGTKARIVASANGPDRFNKIVPWSQLDYGAWIESSELMASTAPLTSQFNNVTAKILPETTEIVFALSSAVPVQVAQGDRTFSLTFHNTSALNPMLIEGAKSQKWNGTVKFTNPVIDRATWQKIGTDQIRCDFQLKPKQQWGYQMRYAGNSLVLVLRQPPKIGSNIAQPLKGIRIVVDPGHGQNDSGAVGKVNENTYLEKTLNLQLASFLQQELQTKGAIVTMTRSTDVNPSLDDRQAIINQTAPAMSISIHHDASASGRVGARGASIYWYHPQSQNLATTLLNYFAREGKRPILNNNGVIEKSFAVARPSGAPAVLLEVGFMTAAEEVTELAQPATQQRLARVLANGIQQWIIDRAIN